MTTFSFNLSKIPKTTIYALYLIHMTFVVKKSLDERQSKDNSNAEILKW